jgi:RNA polymerase sigma-70 factor (ECF subfamily)
VSATDLLLAALSEPARSRGTPERDAVDAWFGRAAAAWPAVPLTTALFAAWVASRLEDAEDPWLELSRLRGGDLWIACACAEGMSAAIAALEATFADAIEQALARVEFDRTQRDELRQIVRHHLFVGDGVGAIARYSGRGPLAAWLRVTATRTALNARRRERTTVEVDDDDLGALPERLRDPELDHLKRTYQEVFREAFAAAAASLTPRERTLLRQAVIHGLTVREVGRMYGVHHATVARWIDHARSALAQAVQRELGGRLRLRPEELASVLVLVRSRLEISIDRVLATPDE